MMYDFYDLWFVRPVIYMRYDLYGLWFISYELVHMIDQIYSTYLNPYSTDSLSKFSLVTPVKNSNGFVGIL